MRKLATKMKEKTDKIAGQMDGVNDTLEEGEKYLSITYRPLGIPIVMLDEEEVRKAYEKEVKRK